MRWNPGYNTRFDSEPADDWRDRAVCGATDFTGRALYDPELWFPVGSSPAALAQAEDATYYCRMCPVMGECRQWALDAGIEFGIWGGLTEDERRAMKRRAARNAALDSGDVDTEIKKRPKPKKTPTIQSLWNECTVKLSNGHVAWTGRPSLKHRQKTYTARQIAFLADRGRHPEGPVHRECPVRGCVAPQHLVDAREREQRAAQTADAL